MSHEGEQAGAGGHQERAASLAHELTLRDDVCLSALDGTGIRLESGRCCRWAPRDRRLHVESNGDHKEVNALDAAEVRRHYKPLCAVPPFGEGTKPGRVRQSVDKLMRVSGGKEAWVIWYN